MKSYCIFVFLLTILLCSLKRKPKLNNPKPKDHTLMVISSKCKIQLHTLPSAMLSPLKNPPHPEPLLDSQNAPTPKNSSHKHPS